ncbi:MAG: universal stress protein [Phycisphaerales bacterium]
MLETSKRPRNLSWSHAGALLFGDWGTSRLYVLGLAFFYTGHLSPLFLGAITVLMVAVAWAYTIVCRSFPDGGGVYASARQISPTLSVIGATLLLCDYIVTASLSVFEGMHYFGVHGELVLPIAITTILSLGIVNWFGARSAGRFALIVAVAALITSALIAVVSMRFVPAGLTTVAKAHPTGGAMDHWTSFVRIVLALSGVEAVANMTGVMKKPVGLTSKKTIWPVLAEVAGLNLLFGIALAGLPALANVVTPHAEVFAGQEVPEAVRAYRDTAMKVLATEGASGWFGSGVGSVFGGIAGIVFGALLISAANTAIVGMVGVQYAMGRDGELPKLATKLNYSGVPKAPLVLACVAPCVVLLFARDLTMLAELYAVGVVGAITIDLLCLARNKKLTLRGWERWTLLTIGVVMLGIEATIVATKVWATIFAGSVIGVVLVTRFVAQQQKKLHAGEPLPEPVTGWIAELRREPKGIDLSKPPIMLAARGRYQAEFAVDMARRRGTTLYAIFVRALRVLDVSAGSAPRVEDDKEALESLGTVAVLARRLGVPFVPVYVCSPDIADEILDFTVTYGCDTLIMGKTRRRWFSRAIEGDVVVKVAQHLPDGVALITRESTPHPLVLPPEEKPSDVGEG